MFIACTGYVSYGVLLWITLLLVIVEIGDKGHSVNYISLL
jgi:hypothetical protein